MWARRSLLVAHAAGWPKRVEHTQLYARSSHRVGWVMSTSSTPTMNRMIRITAVMLHEASRRRIHETDSLGHAAGCWPTAASCLM